MMFTRSSIIAVLCGVLLAGSCLAHAKLVGSTPADNASVATAPKTLTLNFSETAKLVVLILSGAGRDVPVGVDKGAQAARSFDVPLPTLAPGSYTVQWTAIASGDGHVTKGSFAFTVAG
jgi:methionine-rich copper-binding protein CopC